MTQLDLIAAPRTFAEATPPSSTPWGAPQGGWERYAPGIYSCSTAGHGGFWISSQRFAAMPDELKAVNWNGTGSHFFEEDSDWSLVVRAFPDEFSEEMRGYAEKDRLSRIERKRRDEERAAAKASGRGWIRAALNIAVGEFKPEFQEAAQQVETAAGCRLVFVLDDNDRRGIVTGSSYKAGSGHAIEDCEETRLSPDMLTRIPF